MSFLEQNLAALSRRSPRMAGELRRQRTRDDAALIPSAVGPPSLRVSGITVHSTYDPVREAARIVESAVTPRTTACVFLGLGLGYQVESFVRSHPTLPFAVIEPDPSLLALTLQARDLRSILESNQLHLAVAATPGEVVAMLEELPIGELALVEPASLRALSPEYHRSVREAIGSYLERRRINLNTVGRFGLLWVRNLLRNAPLLVRCAGVSAIAGLMDGLPSLVLGAGPSLDEVEPLLGPLAERAVLIAVDSSLGVCLRAGVSPDFVVTVDPQYWNTRYFDRLSSPSSVLVCEPSTHPSTLRRLGPRVFFTSSFFPLGRLVESITGVKGKIGAGGSVATSAWDIARVLGSSPIYLAGVDLGFPDARTHARGSFFEERMVAAALRHRPAETQAYRYLGEAGSLRVPAGSGGLCRTDRRMQVYRWWFEEQLRQHPGLSCFSLSPRGVRVQGMPVRSPDSLLELPVVRQRIDAAMDTVRRLGEPAGRRRAQRTLREALERLSRELASIGHTARLALRVTERLGEEVRGRRDVRRTLGRLDELDRRLLSSASRDIAGFLMQPLIHDIRGRTSLAPEETLEASRKLYAQLADSASLHRRLVDTSVRQMAAEGSPGGEREERTEERSS